MESVINNLLLDIERLEKNRKNIDAFQVSISLAFSLWKFGVIAEEDFTMFTNWLYGHIPYKVCPLRKKLRAIKKAMNTSFQYPTYYGKKGGNKNG